MLLLDYPKSVQPFSFLHILLKSDKIIAQILQRQCLLFGEIVSITVENGSGLALTLRQLELISLPFGSKSNLESEALRLEQWKFIS